MPFKRDGTWQVVETGKDKSAEVPFLFGVDQMKALEAIIDVKQRRVFFAKLGMEFRLEESESGHLLLDLVSAVPVRTHRCGTALADILLKQREKEAVADRNKLMEANRLLKARVRELENSERCAEEMKSRKKRLEEARKEEATEQLKGRAREVYWLTEEVYEFEASEEIPKEIKEGEREKELRSALSSMKSIRKLHKGFHHPSVDQFMKMVEPALKKGWGPSSNIEESRRQVKEWATRIQRYCRVCEEFRKPGNRPKTGGFKSNRPGEVVAIDCAKMQ